jgi:hypothetical protein
VGLEPDPLESAPMTLPSLELEHLEPPLIKTRNYGIYPTNAQISKFKDLTSLFNLFDLYLGFRKVSVRSGTPYR